MTLKAKRNPFFMPSGFTDEEIHNIRTKTKKVKQAFINIRYRKRQENKLVNMIKVAGKLITNIEPKNHHNIFKNTSEQIQRGFDIANKWKAEQGAKNETR